MLVKVHEMERVIDEPRDTQPLAKYGETPPDAAADVLRPCRSSWLHKTLASLSELNDCSNPRQTESDRDGEPFRDGVFAFIIPAAAARRPLCMTAPLATCVITTKNRKAELKGAVESALAQSVPVEVLVVDDGSTDGTPELIREQFPGVRLIRIEQSQGYIVQRNRGAQLARAPVIFSIDDDAAFSTPQTVEQTLSEFEHPRVGAVAIPFINVRQDDIVRQRAPDDAHDWVTNSYVGTAHALRRDVFLSLGGYREHLIHQGEESDFCLRLLARGYVVTLGRADPIHHFESPRRDFRRMDLYGRRNDVLFAWHNVPMPALVPHLLATTANGVAFGLRCRRVGRMIRGLASGYVAALRHARDRRPVSGKVYRLARELKTRGATPLADVEDRLPPLVPAEAQGTGNAPAVAPGS